MDFYAVVLRQSRSYWVALCLENDMVGQGKTQDQAINTKNSTVPDGFIQFSSPP